MRFYTSPHEVCHSVPQIGEIYNKWHTVALYRGFRKNVFTKKRRESRNSTVAKTRPGGLKAPGWLESGANLSTVIVYLPLGQISQACGR